MPVSLLTPIATDLGITEGQAGQTISVSGVFAVLTSLFISALAGKLDRKILLLLLTALMILSGTIVSLAPNYEIFMLGRALIGIAIGGFWSMSAAAAMRLVKDADLPRALAIFQGGNALATVIAAPLGSFLGGLIGWRGAFFFVVPVAIVVLIWQLFSLPSMKAAERTSVSLIFKVLSRPIVALGMAASSLSFMGQFSLFTYLRPYLETNSHVDVSVLSFMLLIMGVSGFFGTLIVGRFLKNSFNHTLISIPLSMGFVAVAMIMCASHFIVTLILLGLWGMFGAASPVAWWTWVARTLPNDAEAGGGLLVAVVQLAITTGAIIGGLLYDSSGYQATFGISALLLLSASVLAFISIRKS